MGGWKLEVCKMAMYISFPVGLFYLFNQPQYFEKFVVETRKQMYPPKELEERQHFRDELKKIAKRKKEQELMKSLENLK